MKPQVIAPEPQKFELLEGEGLQFFAVQTD